MNELARRVLLARAIWGTAAIAAAGTTSGLGTPRIAAPRPRRTAVVDVACLLNTFTPIVRLQRTGR